MSDLSRVVTGLGASNVRTILQSGNAVLTLPNRQVAGFATELENAIAGELGLSISVVVLAGSDFAVAAAANPFAGEDTDPSRSFIGFLADLPDPAGVGALEMVALGSDRVVVIGRQVYLWCPQGLSSSPLFKFPWDRRFGTAMTMRNRATVSKVLDALAQE